MAASLLMIAINWYGPFKSLKSAREEGSKTGVTDFLYLAVSTDENNYAYGGLSSNISQRLRDDHHTIGGLEDGEIDIWIGIVHSQSIAGRKPSDGYVVHSEVLEVAEHMTIYFLELSENDRKRRKPPGRSAAIFNRWFRPHEPYDRRVHRPHQYWPDFIEYECEENEARRIWFGGKNERLDRDAIQAIARKT
jgi:hypothetical protein